MRFNDILMVAAQEGARSAGSGVPITTTDWGRYDFPSGFNTATQSVDIKAGLNLMTFVYAAGADQGAAFNGTVDGNAMTTVHYTSDGGTCVTMSYYSGSDVNGATVVVNWTAMTYAWPMRHIVVTGVNSTPTATTARGWSSVSAPQALASLTVPSGGIAVGLMFASNAITGVASGTTEITRDSSFYEYLCATRDATGSIEATGGGGFSAQIGFAFQPA